MRPVFKHAALTLGAACAFVSCAPSGGEQKLVLEATPRFHTDPGDPLYGSVDAAPFDPFIRAQFETNRDKLEYKQRLFSVHVGDTTALPIIGTYVVIGDTLRFTPKFSPVPGTRYVARFWPNFRPARAHTAEWRPELPSGPPTTVVNAIYPTVDTVPMNLLKMYVEFSAPMSTGRAWEHIKVYAEPDSLLSEPFFTGGDAIELWDPDKTRLTILFDPGRIKRDLKPNEQRGLPLREGRRYRLVIDSAWPDARGLPLARGHVKRFRVGAMDRSLVAPAEWRVVIPRANTRDSLLIGFPEPLDRALLARLLVVRDAAGAAVTGDVIIGGGERRWSFVPRGVWGQTRYHIEVDTELEDLAGNNVRKLFDVAPGDSAARGAGGAKVQMGFVPRER